MRNIPTEQWRALIAVADLHSYTRAAKFLGLSQPAISTQIKRLQAAFGCTLLDRSPAGIVPTAKGELALHYARQIIALHDQVIAEMQPAPDVRRLVVGIPSDCIDSMLASALVDLRRQLPELSVHVHSDISDALLHDLRADKLDIAVAFSNSEPAAGARHFWIEQTAWAAAPDFTPPRNRPLPLVTYDSNCVYSRLAAAALSKAGMGYEITFTASNIASLAAAVAAGFGVTVLATRCLPEGLAVPRQFALPSLPGLVCGIYLQPGEKRAPVAQLSDTIARLVRQRQVPRA